MKNKHGRIKIGVIDSGINFNHQMLAGQEPRGVSFDLIDGEVKAGSSFFDVNGHGTSCAGIILEKAPNAQLFSIKVLDKNLRSRGDVLVRAIEWAIDNKIDILNISLGTTSTKHKNDLLGVCDRAIKNNIMMIGAVNGKGMVNYPSSFKGVFAVEVGKIKNDANFYYQESIDLWIAKGDPQLVAGLFQDMLFMGGSSMAAPHLTGIVASFLEKQPDVSLAEVENYLKSKALKLPEKGLELLLGSKYQDFSLSQKEREKIRKQYSQELERVVETISEVSGLKKESIDPGDCLVSHRDMNPKYFYRIACILSKNFNIYFKKEDFCLEVFYAPLNITKKIIEKVTNKEKNQCLSTLIS